ncbi:MULTISPECIES: DUF1223 domain-containing protein [unclassified Beijerinckia]|uniref:DUF1223 domain-containing protein n=1 Tax=unclassified Beijerinckia TaxID=2638183 RepID=UPI0008942C11|nr:MULTISPECIES: DUF1223 domain-containing protein [unclassified Beijerinckia]MDH7799440.1 hypothetical protein [Beijerinckia sp. GAS462]SED50523.1 hypothetical protein SAMN05443249_5558 [Beijerinckia sp. 28-YEA-48]
MSQSRTSARSPQGPYLSRRAFAAGGACAALVAASAGAHAQTSGPTFEKPVFIELFTSQGCSSCPAADRVLSQIARQPNVIALTLAVDYWDYLGWKDTFASNGNTGRQKGYSKTIPGSHVYTPQAVINGVAQVVGSDLNALVKEARIAFGKHGALSVPMTIKDAGDKLLIDVGAGGGNAALSLVRVASRREVEVARGDNTGKQLSYTNIGRGRVPIGDWSGGAKQFEIAKADTLGNDADGWIVMLQSYENGKPGPILAARKSSNL